MKPWEPQHSLIDVFGFYEAMEPKHSLIDMFGFYEAMGTATFVAKHVFGFYEAIRFTLGFYEAI